LRWKSAFVTLAASASRAGNLLFATPGGAFALPVLLSLPQPATPRMATAASADATR
jgi:hypothetical protein